MMTHRVPAVLLIVASAIACQSEPTPPAPSTGTAGTSAPGIGVGVGVGAGGTGTGMSTAGVSTTAPGQCLNRGEINFDCPFNLPPIMGSCAPAGTCCHRTSNAAKLETLGPNDPVQIEYRLNYVDIYNHPQSVGLPDIQRTAGQRAEVCSGEQCLLWRFTAPRANGQYVAGKGEVEIGVGAYNCDGTYSFYGPSAAPDRTKEVGEAAPTRWQSVKVPADVDPSKTNVDRFHIPWATNRNREIARSIFLFPTDNTIDWELASSGFLVTQIEWNDAALDCIGSRNGIVGWNTVAGFESYSPIEGNDRDISNQINQTYCALLGFGLLPEGMKNKDCKQTARCMPDGGAYGDGGCDWIKLPDALCPTTEAERALYGCHLGAEGNPKKRTDIRPLSTALRRRRPCRRTPTWALPPPGSAAIRSRSPRPYPRATRFEPSASSSLPQPRSPISRATHCRLSASRGATPGVHDSSLSSVASPSGCRAVRIGRRAANSACRRSGVPCGRHHRPRSRWCSRSPRGRTGHHDAQPRRPRAVVG